MNNLLARICLLCCAAALMAAAPARAADLKKGEDLVNKGGCAACHGAGLDKPIAPTYPSIAGQHASYLFHALQQYQAAHQTPLYGRTNPIMGGIVAQYSDADLHNIAAYVASLKGPLYSPDKSH